MAVPHSPLAKQGPTLAWRLRRTLLALPENLEVQVTHATAPMALGLAPSPEAPVALGLAKQGWRPAWSEQTLAVPHLVAVVGGRERLGCLREEIALPVPPLVRLTLGPLDRPAALPMPLA